MHDGGWWSYLRYDAKQDNPTVSWALIKLVSALAIMLQLEWRLTILAVAVLPLFLIPARLLGNRLREVVRDQLTLNSEMNALMNETLNVSGALLVKLFNRAPNEVGRF